MLFFKKSLIILLGSILVAFGINFFLVPFHLLDGGGVGIGLIIHYLLNIKVGLAIICISIPIFLVAWVYYRSFFYNGIHGLLFSSVVIDFLYPLHIAGEKLISNSMIGAICGGFFVGLGIGLMLRFGITIGGTDLLAQMIAKLLRANPGLCILAIDIVVVTVGSILVDSVSLFHSCITVISVGITTSMLVKRHY
ncbi:YitT family protein [Psychrobacillus vulpis]|uniref:YitT family protein n=1 Tax=Psychrobacillus vulpis TaxID=2325572 RepID=A0A544TFH8_9BACI|nr:YitT family protein [Psychrobacillus vulpis]TQR16211.1 YitT family protein [Psychrobacillus vulpis]